MEPDLRRAREDATLLQYLLRSRATALHSLPRPRNGRLQQGESSTSADNADFGSLWENALDEYLARTGIDLRDRDQDLYRRLQSCSSSDHVVVALEKIAVDFRVYRSGSSPGIAKLRSALSAIAHGVYVLIDIGAESAASKSFPGGKAIFVAIAVLIKATQGVSKRFDALLAILEKFGFYLSRLHIRLDVGLGPESRHLTIQLLSKMVHAFALLTQTMKHGRMHHFVSVLFDRNDKTDALTQHVDQLMEEDSRLGLVEIHRAVSNISQEMDDKLLAPLSGMQNELANVREIMQIEFASLSAQIASSTRLEIASPSDRATPSSTIIRSAPQSMSTFFSSWEEKRFNATPTEDLDPDPNALTPSQHFSQHDFHKLSERVQALELEQIRSRKDNLSQLEDRSTVLWCLRATVSTLHPANLARMIDQLHAGFRDLTPEDLAALREGIATLYSIAATTVTGGARGETLTAGFALWLNPRALFTAFLPMAAAYTVAYLCWQRAHRTIPGRLQEPHMDTITLIDVLGVHMLLPLDRVSTWRDLHALLLRQFSQKDGVEYVKREAYRIMNAHEGSTIHPQSWTRTLRDGLTLEMSIVLRRRFLECPYCSTSVNRPMEEGRTLCIRCGRYYWATRSTTANSGPCSVEET